jgi:hypothetical protein
MLRDRLGCLGLYLVLHPSLARFTDDLGRTFLQLLAEYGGGDGANGAGTIVVSLSLDAIGRGGTASASLGSESVSYVYIECLAIHLNCSFFLL